jgi:hypothetical protein
MNVTQANITPSTHLLELGASVRLSAFATFELHSFDCESFLFGGEVPCTGILRHVRKKDEAEESHR